MTTKTQHRENARVIRAAIEVLQRDGWRRFSMGERGEAHCVLGAFKYACKSRKRQEETVYADCLPAQAFAQCLSDQGLVRVSQFTYNRVVYWNDRVAMTETEVIRTLEECAKSEEAKGAWKVRVS